jgi:hypothetical protein
MVNVVKVARYRNSRLAATFGVPHPADDAARRLSHRYHTGLPHALAVANLVNAGIVTAAKARR